MVAHCKVRQYRESGIGVRAHRVFGNKNGMANLIWGKAK